MRTHMTKGFKAAARVLFAGGLVAAVACGDFLEVDNPNAVPEDELTNAAAAPNMANGVLAATVRALSGTTVPYSVATDELDWIGSRDSWRELERGVLSNPINEFTDAAFPFLGEARYLADVTISRLEGFRTANRLTDSSHLARTYLYAAIVYASIADMYHDFAFSTKHTPANPVGRANMGTLYDNAIANLDKANTLVNVAGANAASVALRYPIMAYRARVKHGKAVWQKITPTGTTAPAQPLVSDAGANADVTAALALTSVADNKFNLTSNVEARAGINIWFEVNGRNEHRTGIYYRNLNDPVTGLRDATATAQLAAFTAFGQNSGVFTLTSNRELRLIRAEAFLLAGDIVNFRLELNAVRALDGKPAYVGVGATDQQMLEHERSVHLWLMRRRLSDMHRFNLEDPNWVDISGFQSAKSVHGLLFPIPYGEILSNPCVTTACTP
jgi:hypothetical protein